MDRTIWRKGRAAVVGSALVLALAACDGGSAVAPARSHASLDSPAGPATPDTNGGPSSYGKSAYDNGGPGQMDHRQDPVRLVKGKPVWAANRLHSAEDNAQYHFERDGADFGARSVDDYVAKVHAFVDAPPPSVQTISRSNGDRLLYDAQRNVFAVVSKDGAPRTMFKPRDGADYWAQQTQREAQKTSKSGANGQRYGRRSSTTGDDTGGEG
jgi:hypothetical protein